MRPTPEDVSVRARRWQSMPAIVAITATLGWAQVSVAEPAMEFSVGPLNHDASDAMAEVLLPRALLPADAASLSVVEIVDGAARKAVPAQVGPDSTPWRASAETAVRIAWTMPGHTPAGASRRFALGLASSEATGPAVTIKESDQHIIVRTPTFEVTHDKARAMGLSHITWLADGAQVEVQQCDEFYSGKTRRHNLYESGPAARIEVRERGPLRVTISVEADLQQSELPPIRVCYTYTYYAALPVVRVQTWVPRQSPPVAYDSMRLVHLGVRQGRFDAIVSGDPITRTGLPAPGQRYASATLSGAGGTFKRWGGLVDPDGRAIGILGAGAGGVWGTLEGQGIGGPGRAVYHRGPWQGQEERWTGYLYIGRSDTNGHAISRVAADIDSLLSADVHLPSIEHEAQRLIDAGRASESMSTRVSGAVAGTALRMARTGRRIVTCRALLRAADEAAATDEHDLLLLDRDDVLVIANAHLALVWARMDGQLHLLGLAHVGSGHVFQQASPTPAPVWAATLGSPDGATLRDVDVAAADAFEYKAARDGDAIDLSLRWRGCPAPGGGEVDADVAIRLEARDAMSRWRIAVEPRSDDEGLWRVAFPRLTRLGASAAQRDAEFLAMPVKQGVLYATPSNGVQVADTYPSHHFMQFMTYWCGDANLYLATYDPLGTVKTFAAMPDESSGAFGMEVALHPPDTGIPGRAYTQAFDAVVGAIDGDWYDACQVYRQWALQQDWCARGPVHERDDIPSWFKNNCLTFRPGGDADTAVPAMLGLRRAFGDIPALVNWYNRWGADHLLQFIPELRPPEPGFTEALATFKDAGMPVVAYSCIELWSTEREDWQETGLPAAIKKSDGTLYQSVFTGGQQAAVCPSAETYRGLLTRSLVEPARQYAIKGYYLDLLGCGPHPCFDASHGHPIGGGHHWTQAYRSLMADIRAKLRAVEPDFVMFGESNTEVLLDVRDANILFHGVTPDLTPHNLPMHQVVYGDYTLYYGANTSGFRNPPIEATLPMSNFIYGGMIGRLFNDEFVAGKPEFYETVLRLARYRQACLPYFVGARVLRPPAVTCVSDPESPLERAGRAILSCARRAPDGDSVALMFANALYPHPNPDLRRTIVFEIDLDPSEYGFAPGDPVVVSRLTPDATTRLGETTGRLKLELSLEAAGVDVLILEGRDGD